MTTVAKLLSLLASISAVNLLQKVRYAMNARQASPIHEEASDAMCSTSFTSDIFLDAHRASGWGSRVQMGP